MEPINIENTRQEALAHAIELAGPQATFFAQHQARIITSIAKKHTLQPKNVLDYGCGDGTLTFLLNQQLPQANIHGVDSSQELIEIAQEWYGKPTLRYNLLHKVQQITPSLRLKLRRARQGERFKKSSTAHLECPTKLKAKAGVSRDYDLIYLANVLHHIPKQEHKKIIEKLLKHLAPNGMLIILELNPYNFVQAWRFYQDKEEKGNRMLWPNYVKELVAPYGAVQTQFFRNSDCVHQSSKLMRYMPRATLYGVMLRKDKFI